MVEYASNLNCPLYVRQRPAQEGSLPAAYSFVSCDAKNIMVDTVKLAEADDSVIVRLYENYNCLTSATLTFDRPILKAYLCNLMEEQDVPVLFDGNRITLDVKPYEIVTLKLLYR
jgi:alpha-mannosidase